MLLHDLLRPCYPRQMPAPILPLIDAAALWPARGALIGLDLGTKTIGVAASDPDRRLATGVDDHPRKAFKADAARLLALAAERSAAGFVLGLPINMDGCEGPRAQSTRAFARNLAKLTELPIGLWDERLSTAAVERDLIAADVEPRQARRGDRRARGDLHPAGRARPADDACARDRLTHGRRHRRAVSGVPADRARLHAASRWLMRLDTHWLGLERLTLLRDVSGAADRHAGARRSYQRAGAGVGGALLRRALLMAALCLALRPLLARGSASTARPSRRCSRARRAGRLSWHLPSAGNLYGDLGLALASVAMVAMIPVLNVLSVWVLARYASPRNNRYARSR